VIPEVEIEEPAAASVGLLARAKQQ
jgi:hypothetical protein